MDLPTTPEQWTEWAEPAFPQGVKFNYASFGGPGVRDGDPDEIGYDATSRLIALDHPREPGEILLVLYGLYAENPRYLRPTKIEHDPEDGTYLMTGSAIEGDFEWLVAPLRKSDTHALDRIKEFSKAEMLRDRYYKEILA